jgi:hypothetical protein
MTILLGDFNAKVNRKDIFKSTVGNESLHEIRNDNLVRVVNFATSKNPIVKIKIFPHHKINKFTWTTSDGKTHNQIVHTLLDRTQNSSILEDRLFSAAHCDTDHYLVVAKIRERLAVSKQTTHRFHMERFNLKKLNEVEDKERYHVENLDTEEDINRARETIKENVNISAKEYLGYYELKKHTLSHVSTKDT